MDSKAYDVLPILEDEVKSGFVLHSQIGSLLDHFLKYLKEPRYQSPLTIAELSNLFQRFYKDLQSTIVGLYTLSNSTKKQLIANSEYFKSEPQKFDYLLAISSYSSSSIKLVKRSDPDALVQLRIFNYYKFLRIFESIENAILNLFTSKSLGEGTTLFEKIFKFDQRDIIYQEFLDEKLSALKNLDIPFSKFHEADDEVLGTFLENLTEDDILEINQVFVELSHNITPYSKLVKIVELQKLVSKLLSKVYEYEKINNDILLPTIIYLIIYKLNPREIYLNFVFIRNFVCLLDPYNIELLQINVTTSYVPTIRDNKSVQKQIRRANLFHLLNLDEMQNRSLEGNNADFFSNDKDLINYISSKFLNNGELNFYLTNFEAVIVFLSNILLSELAPEESSTNSLLLHSINVLIDQEISAHFQFPEGKLTEELKIKDDFEKSSRSRSSSLLNTISNKITETRSRSNSSIVNSLKSSNISLNRENFPTLSSNDGDSLNSPATEADNTSSFAMMKNIIGRLSSVSVPQFRTNEEVSTPEGMDIANHKRSTSLISRISPNHSRTRSSSLETAIPVQLSNRNSITSKFTTGMSELMTKFNTNISDQTNTDTSSQILETMNPSTSLETHDTSIITSPRRPDYSRGRTTSLQVMDKWFNNLSNSNNNDLNHQANNLTHSDEGSISSGSLLDLTKYQNVDFESLSIIDLKNLKACYDQLCKELCKESIITKIYEEH
ncbi:uncharacterized protein PRCAT00003606001 [Priceomyces carsonii]|uniref:uncharacterized protein n=1 Tax=Priceomyces carsonii TaxID=28549 RepID=UPI002ED881E2|nr:unnamed protein product [Priceomyces carsonii]